MIISYVFLIFITIQQGKIITYKWSNRDDAATIGESIDPNCINLGGSHLHYNPKLKFYLEKKTQTPLHRDISELSGSNPRKGGVTFTFLGMISLRGYLKKHRVMVDLPLTFSTVTSPDASAISDLSLSLSVRSCCIAFFPKFLIYRRLWKSERCCAILIKDPPKPNNITSVRKSFDFFVGLIVVWFLVIHLAQIFGGNWK